MVGATAAGLTQEVGVAAGGVRLRGRLVVPEGSQSMVVFAHGSGSSRHSPRNRYVADRLVRAGLGTLLLDLLTAAESADRRNVFDVALLAHRLLAVRGWLQDHARLGTAQVGLFGASTGAAAALLAAAEPGSRIGAVVSRGGRPDLAASGLVRVTAPTLLVVGGDDPAVLELNRRAAAMLRCEHRLVVVPGATHLFEEPGALETVAGVAAEWFLRHLTADRPGEQTPGARP
jgi:putative phosphoribosyl transferase